MAYQLGKFTFSTEEELEKAKKELEQIQKIKGRYDLENPEIARKLLGLIKEGKLSLETAVGKAFIKKLQQTAASGENTPNQGRNAVENDRANARSGGTAKSAAGSGAVGRNTTGSNRGADRIAEINSENPAKPSFLDRLMYCLPGLAAIGYAIMFMPSYLDMVDVQLQFANLLMFGGILFCFLMASMYTGIGKSNKARNMRVEAYEKKHSIFFRYHLPKPVYVILVVGIIVVTIVTTGLSFMGSEAPAAEKQEFMDRMVGE